MTYVVSRHIPERLRWWQTARFGVSFHWGAYSVAARGEWVRSAEKLSIEAYQTYVDRFLPEPGAVQAWATAAKQAGAGYGLLTTKHHDGFCLFASDLTTYTSAASACGRDLVREYVEAFRAQGLKVGLYYSLLDWHHPDYPAWHDRQHPSRFDERFRDRPGEWARYVTYFHGQVRELLTKYGRIDLLCFDFSYWAFGAEAWRADELVRMIRSLQPDILINDRLDPGCPVKRTTPPAWAGDFDSPEQLIPDHPVCDDSGRQIPWETWVTDTNSWCYAPADHTRKSAREVIHHLIHCVSQGGNLCLNFGPDAHGRIEPAGLALLADIGTWMAANGAAIRGCGPAGLGRPPWGYFTSDGATLYAHVTEPALGHLSLPGLRGKVRRGRVLANGTAVHLTPFWNAGVQTFGAPDDVFFNFAQPVQSTHRPPDPCATVVAFDLVPEAAWAAVAREQTATPEVRVPFA
jgi:alpha-L-fucosidase